MFDGSGRTGGARQRVPETLAFAATQQLHYDLALAVQAHRYANLEAANAALERAAAQAREQQSASEEAQRRQTEFMALVAHELRNPLTPILTAAELLGRAPMDDALPGKLQAIIERQVLHISRLVDDLLDLARVRTGKLTLERSVVDLHGVIETTIGSCRPALDGREQKLIVAVPSGPLEVDGDPIRLVQILVNLLENASKYTPQSGAIELSVMLEGDSVILAVSDSGIGISTEDLPYVFEPFARAPQAVGYCSTGLGLGLAVVRELVLAHGGKVVAQSSGSGHGSRFVVTIPVADRSAAPMRGPDEGLSP